MRSVKLIAGLGNPGLRFRKTRHNVGFMVVDALAKRLDVKLKKANALEGECGKAGDVVLLKPLTFMNLSGPSIQKVCSYYSVDEMLIVMDDIDTPFGELRLREKGSSGGHNGLKDVIRIFGSEFQRLKVGVNQPPEGMDLADYVLAKFSKEELKTLPSVIEAAATVCETWLRDGFQTAATRMGKE